MRGLKADATVGVGGTRGRCYRVGRGAGGGSGQARTGAGLGHAGDKHDRQPARGRGGLKRSEAARRHVGELELLGGREVAREAHASVDRDDVDEAKHGRAAVLDLHDLIAAHVTLLDQAERVPDAERRGDTNIALGEHGGLDGALRGHHGRRIERESGGGERESHCKSD